MTDQPTPETDAMFTDDAPEQIAAFCERLERERCERLERERNAARAERDELNRQLSVALKGKRPYSSEFADETIASQVKRIAEMEEKLNGWFSERDALRADAAGLRTALEGMIIAEMEVRKMVGLSADEVEAEPHWMAARAALAERDIAFSLGEHAMVCVHHTDAERVANTVGGNCPICNKVQIRQLRAERDTANALSLSLCADMDGDAKDRDDEIAVLRTNQRNELDEVWAKLAECRAALEMIASADGATTPGTAAWASAEIARAVLATLSK